MPFQYAIIGIVCAFVSASASTAMFFLILWQSPRSRDNQLACVLMASMMLWSIGGFMARVMALMSFDSFFFYQFVSNGLVLTSVSLFVFSLHFARLFGSLPLRIAAVLGAVFVVVTGILIASGRVHGAMRVLPDGRVSAQLYPLAYPLLLIALAYLVTSALLLRFAREKRARALFPGAVVLCLGVASAGQGTIGMFGPILSVAVGSLLFGRTILHEKLFQPLVDTNQSLSAAMAQLTRELAERKRIEVELREASAAAQSASRATNAFLATMSHELRTPLNIVIGYCELLEEEAADAGQTKIRADLVKIQGAAKHLLELIGSILDYTKVESGALELRRVDVDLAKLLGDLAEKMQVLAARNGNTLVVRGREDAGTTVTDPTYLLQILYNLAGNAAKFTQNGRIEIEVARETDEAGREWVIFRVRDTGPGIAADQLSQLFQEFRQVDASLGRRHGGAGLGLAISRRLCRHMGGDIEVASVVGEGTTFIVRLPANLPAVKDGY
ncbi:MAG: hypothetical protein HUU21_06790 [Polyangiaceae bacterium]|nr:hypothetical protein [Polyangiaceae bacterium]